MSTTRAFALSSVALLVAAPAVAPVSPDAPWTGVILDGNDLAVIARNQAPPMEQVSPFLRDTGLDLPLPGTTLTLADSLNDWNSPSAGVSSRTTSST